MTESKQAFLPSHDAYAPAQIALRIESGGVAKANMPALKTATLGILAGAFISFGALLLGARAMPAAAGSWCAVSSTAPTTRPSASTMSSSRARRGAGGSSTSFLTAGSANSPGNGPSTRPSFAAAASRAWSPP